MAIELKSGLGFIEVDGAALKGDLYLPQGPGPHPVLVAVPGGGWRRGDKAQLRAWGEHLAANGGRGLRHRLSQSRGRQDLAEELAGRLGCPGVPPWGKPVNWGLTPSAWACSAHPLGAHLAALAALADPAVKVLVGVYGVYDLMAHWQADLAQECGAG